MWKTIFTSVFCTIGLKGAMSITNLTYLLRIWYNLYTSWYKINTQVYKLYQQVYKLYHRTKTRYVHQIVPIFLEYGTIYTPLVQNIHLLVQLIHFKRLDISPFGMRVLIVVFILYQSVSYHLLGLKRNNKRPQTTGPN